MSARQPDHHGTEYRPEGENLPIAIVCHGFMTNQGTVLHYAKALAAMGYAAYCFDFCGGVIGGKSDGKTTDMSVLSEVADPITVIAHAKTLPHSDPSKVTLMGYSRGFSHKADEHAIGAIRQFVTT